MNLHRLLQRLFFLLVVKPVLLLVLGGNIRHAERLPERGPAVLVANHNSHLDTLVLMSLFPARMLPRLHPVAAMDYFMRNRPLAWFATRIIGILPLSRSGLGRIEDKLKGCGEALERGDILILFPEGTRGEPEKMSKFKRGVAYLARGRSGVPFIPLFLRGLGKSLPKGAFLPLPFFCDVFIGPPVYWKDDLEGFTAGLEQAVGRLARKGRPSRFP